MATSVNNSWKVPMTIGGISAAIVGTQSLMNSKDNNSLTAFTRALVKAGITFATVTFGAAFVQDVLRMMAVSEHHQERLNQIPRSYTNAETLSQFKDAAQALEIASAKKFARGACFMDQNFLDAFLKREKAGNSMSEGELVKLLAQTKFNQFTQFVENLLPSKSESTFSLFGKKITVA